jgi:exopolysaccharide biosynthesis protein
MTTKTKRFVLFSSRSRKHLTQKRKKSVKKRLLILGIVVALLAGLYCTAVFSNIPFIKKWRDIYIETAMDTYSHKWLATFFIPKSVIDEVMAKKDALIASQQDLVSSWEPAESPSPNTQPSANADASAPVSEEPDHTLKEFLETYDDIDEASFNDYISNNLNLIKNGYDKLLINEAGPDGNGTPIYTKNGDQILVLDAENGIIIAEVKGDGFVGKLAIVKDPSRVKLGISKYLGDIGQTVQTIAKNYKAVLAINASGFADPEWKGNGGKVVGLLVSNGKIYNEPIRNGYLNIGFSPDNRLYIGLKKNEYRDAVEFIPALIINGEKVTDGSTGFGIQPRSAIGQKEDGTVLLLTVDGRQIGYSLGCTVGDCTDVLLDYDAYQASNLDGGSSTVMVYRDEVINKPSSATNVGRLVPDAFIVEYASNEDT